MFNPADIQAVVATDTPAGYELFYTLVWDRPAPEHVMAEWIKPLFAYRKSGDPVLLKAFRGSTKTTSITNTLAAYLHGCYPNKTGLFIQAGDDSATKNSGAVAEIIEFNAGWKVCFPNVVPDKERGWSSTGYNIKDTRVEYNEWVRMRSRDPSFVGYGYTSNSIIGMHPSMYLFVDDIHNEENTRSEREIRHVKSVYSGTLMPTRDPHKPFLVIPHTPWTPDDLYADLERTGAYKVIKTPVKRGETMTWPEAIDAERLKQIEKEDITGGIEVARMYYLDLTAKSKRVFKYQTYPSHLINVTWPMAGGCDYADAPDPKKLDNASSHFALAYVAKVPEGGAVVYDGVVEQWSQAESEGAIARAQNMFPNYAHTVIESDGKGLTFYNMLYRKPEMKVYPMKTKGRSKPQRLVNELGPHLESGRIRFSDGDTKFLNTARNFMNRYPNVGEHDPGWDCMDAVYWAVMGMPEAVVMPNVTDYIPLEGKRKQLNPWAALGSA